MAVEFGEPESVLNRRAAIMDMLECRWQGRWFNPPVPLDGLTRAFHASPHHESALRLKRNLLTSSFRPTRLLSRRAFSALALDFLVLGNGYLEELPNRIGGAARFEHTLGKYMRIGAEGSFFQVRGWQLEHEFTPGSIAHVKMPCLDQEIYGIPEYLAALQSAFLNENATLFRRRYYLNGSHAGFILHLDGQFEEKSVDGVRDALKGSRGVGNFRNMLLVSNGEGTNKEKVKLIPIAEVAAKDEFLGIKNVTRDDVLAAHRVPHQLIGVVPGVTGGYGDTSKAVDAFIQLEILPLQDQLMDLNDALGATVVDFAERQTS
ncbi:phage portal protein [Novosphingopyxis sp. YJ-S2-01]|nr:phage portal protein [Novosphingopyxis sp. YJ-S2-01]